MKIYEFCPICKSGLVTKKVDDNSRLVCSKCGWVHYMNPLPSVVVFLRNTRGDILLIRRGIAPGKGEWALPSGFVEYDELPQNAVLRELKEETSITGKINSFIGFYMEPTKVYGNVLLIAYDIGIVKGKPKHGSDTIDARFFPAGKLPKIPFNGHRAIIRDGLAARETDIGLVEVLKSKVSEAIITKTVLHYKGSMGLDARIMKEANLIPGEKVHVLNYNNGERLETYTIEEEAGTGKVILYGPASLKGKIGDKLCILSYMFANYSQAQKAKPKIVILDKKNRLKKIIN